MTPEQKQWIDKASYEDLMAKRRFAPVGDAMFTDDECYAYFSAAMIEKQKGQDKVAVSKRIGW